MASNCFSRYYNIFNRFDGEEIGKILKMSFLDY